MQFVIRPKNILTVFFLKWYDKYSFFVLFIYVVLGEKSTMNIYLIFDLVQYVYIYRLMKVVSAPLAQISPTNIQFWDVWVLTQFWVGKYAKRFRIVVPNMCMAIHLSLLLRTYYIQNRHCKFLNQWYWNDTWIHNLLRKYLSQSHHLSFLWNANTIIFMLRKYGLTLIARSICISTRV